jgi:hypothetical protein
MSHPTIDRLQRGLFTALSGVADVVSWAGGEQPRGTGSLLSLAIAGSSSRVLSVLRLYPADAAEIQVGTVEPGDLAAVDLNGYRVRHHVSTTETPEDVRDALMVRLAQAETGIGVSPVGTDTIALSASSVSGSIWSLAAVGVATVVEDSVATMTDAVEVTFSRELYAVEFEAFSRLREPRHSAHGIITQARARIASQNHVDALSLLGVQAWTVGDAVDISAIAGAHWESRARLAVECALRAVSVEAVSTIESATIAIEAVAAI